MLVRIIDYRLEGVPEAEPVYRLITTLLDPDTAPAGELAALYHERWEAEGIFTEIKVTLPGRRLMLRSRRADLVEQEVYGAAARPLRAAPPAGAGRPGPGG